MIPKEEATSLTPLSADDSAAINGILKQAMTKMFESAIDHEIVLPWKVEAIDNDGDVIARMTFAADAEGDLVPIRDDTPAGVEGNYFSFPLTVTLMGRNRGMIELKIEQPKPDLPEPKFLN